MWEVSIKSSCVHIFIEREREGGSIFDINLRKQIILQDEANSSGGKWIVRLRKGLASRCWENLILAILGEQFMVNDEICGAVVSVRYQEDIISIWNRTASDQTTTTRIRDTLKRVLNLPPNTILEYKVRIIHYHDKTRLMTLANMCITFYL